MYNVLFINCPFGRFFSALCAYGDSCGFRFERMAFDAGDYFEAPPGRRHLFRGDAGDWPDAIASRLARGRYDLVIVYNDALPFNAVAVACVVERGVPFLTLENGYLRPHWVTVEEGGVNGNSPLLNATPPVRHFTPVASAQDDVLFDHRMANHVYATIRHFLTAFLLSPVFPYRPRYYGVSIRRQCMGYAREYFRSWGHREKIPAVRVGGCARKHPDGARHFLCLLQKPGDTQLRVHSDISTNTEFLEQVLESFARHAPADAVLAVKRHPYDYGIESLRTVFGRLVKELGIEDRCCFLERMKMFETLDWADAVVVNNSSGGLNALQKGLPVIALGRAIFNQSGLTFEGGLDAFWAECVPPDSKNVARLVTLLRGTSQLNGGFYTTRAREILFPRLIERLRAVLELRDRHQVTPRQAAAQETETQRIKDRARA